MKLWFFLVHCLLITGGMFATPLKVTVTLEPQRYLVEKIGGNRVQVHVMVPSGKNPHTYEPLPSQMVELSRSSVWFTIGLEFETQLVNRIQKSYHNLQIVDTSQGIKKRSLLEHEIPSHHEAGEDHEEHEDRVGAPDPHIWMSLRLATLQAKTILDKLSSLDPEGKEIYEKNYSQLIQKLQNLDNEIRQQLNRHRGKTFFIYHPVLGYFADDYGLIQQSIEIEGKEPSSRQIHALVQKAKQQKVKVIFVQQGFSQKSAQAIAKAIGGKVVEINPLDYNYETMIKKISQTLIGAWQ
ncbi:metal ABC transporter solute-binding protein, Zn/Mn family [Thermospira aquatica]|uniref:Zinc ABC transporter substrate-binding protein n=1 Tax=Thermospira aquatica TaxID=2828656 RepID=A0AAX3BAZ4_9SPIR|nr:zinc ABC transporter substrate-binding protein [Thermospira aquatica]URA09174.1 zinc ABC transporter substrate-binding protein [Thermospira aquatica]